MSSVAGRGHDAGPDEGAVTAEFALALPAATLVLGLVFGAGSAAITQLQVVAAAGLAGRELARNSPVARVQGVVAQQAGTSAELTITPLPDGRLSAVVTKPVRLPVPGEPSLKATWRSVITPEDVGVADG